MTDHDIPIQVRDGEGTVWTRREDGRYECDHSIADLTSISQHFGGYTPVVLEDDRPSLPEARAARDAAVVQVEGNADAGWFDAALDAVVHVAAKQPGGFIGDDVWTALADLHPQLPAPHEPRAMGAVMRRAVKEGIAHLKTCTACGTTKVMTTGRSRASHAGDVPVYVAGVNPEKDALAGVAAAQAAYEAAQAGRRAAILHARDVGGFTYRQIAEAMGLSVGNVYSLVKAKA